MKHQMRLVVAVLVVLIGAGCASPNTWSRYEVCFGLSADGGRTIVSNQQWREFRDQHISTRFPDGFTVYEAEGCWRSDGKTVVEPSRVLMIVAPNTEDTRSRLRAITEAYIHRFHQESVLQIMVPADVEFHDKDHREKVPTQNGEAE